MMAKDKQADTGITEADIDELESLIAETKLPPKLKGEIPVLNDVVDSAEVKKYAQNEKTNSDPGNIAEDFPIERLNQLVDSVDKKLSNELDSLVDILKDTIKDSIIDELKEELKKEAVKKTSSPSKIAPSAKPPE